MAEKSLSVVVNSCMEGVELNLAESGRSPTLTTKWKCRDEMDVTPKEFYAIGRNKAIHWRFEDVETRT
ncbi:MAG: hypothetical protein SAK29_13480 [Scytonema sp. PMC 1069.18]|nr:hypothetical protein [Scytonema sp. PMC 1069.18]MEC4886432.1 hypothetical protein [Scytonema sp. PMC 1070.18]